MGTRESATLKSSDRRDIAMKYNIPKMTLVKIWSGEMQSKRLLLKDSYWLTKGCVIVTLGADFSDQGEQHSCDLHLQRPSEEDHPFPCQPLLRPPLPAPQHQADLRRCQDRLLQGGHQHRPPGTHRDHHGLRAGHATGGGMGVCLSCDVRACVQVLHSPSLWSASDEPDTPLKMDVAMEAARNAHENGE